MDLISSIKDVAHDVTEQYVIYKKNLNDAILEVYYDGKIDNLEILKRVCELANQNVYLALYNDSSVDKTNIQFPLADYEYLKNEIQQSEKSMKDFGAPPSDYRPAAAIAIDDSEIEPVEKTASLKQPEDKTCYLTDFAKLSSYRNAINQFVNTINTIKSGEIRRAEEELLKIAHQTRIMVGRGESIGDIALISSRYLKSEGLDFTKIASVYNTIHKDMVNDGFTVSTEFTKLSSLTINKKSAMLDPVREFVLCIEKAAACNEMVANISKVQNALNKVVNQAIR